MVTVREVLQGVTVEPVIFIVFTGFLMSNVALSTGSYWLICNEKYANEPDVNCSNLRPTKHAEDVVQSLTTDFNMYVTLSYLIPSVFSTLLLSAWSDRAGRKINTMSSIAGVSISVFGLLLILNAQSVPIYTILATAFLSGCFGYISLLFVSNLAYLADTTLDTKFLTFKMLFYQLATGLGAMTGALSSGPVFDRFGYSGLTVIPLGLFFIALIYVIVRIKQVPPVLMKRQIAFRKGINLLSDDVKPYREDQSVCQTVISLLKEGVYSYVKPREGHRRAFVWGSVFVSFVFGSVDIYLASTIFLLYAQGRPFLWKTQDVALYNAYNGVSGLVGVTAGIIFFKRFAKWRNTSIEMVAILSAIGKLVLVGTAQSTLQIYIGITVGMFEGLNFPTIKGGYNDVIEGGYMISFAFLAQMVPPDEVGKIFAIYGLASDCSIVFAAIVYNAIYKASVSSYRGTVFLIAAGLFGLCLIVMGWICVQAKREGAELAPGDSLTENDKK